ncbi:MAG: murein L,D-transpeptidase [Reyranella sp.]
MTSTRRRMWACGLILTILGGFAPVSNAWDEVQFAAAVQQMLAERRHPDLKQGDLASESDILTAVYAGRDYRPLWRHKGTVSPQANAIVRRLLRVSDEGLPPSDYDGDVLASSILALDSGADDDEQRWARLDLGLSTALLRLITHLHYGRIDPRQAGFNTPIMAPSHLDRAAVLLQLATADDTDARIYRVEPPFQHYRRLKAILPRLRQLAADPELTRLPPLPAEVVRAGGSYVGAPALRVLLRALGDLASDDRTGGSLIFDQELSAAVARFQRRHGLQADGTLGPATYKSLTTPLSRRVRQVELTLERWRWLPRFERPPIIVNIPQFRLFALRTTDDAESDVLQMDVIVGQTFARMRTPIFAADMSYVVFRPYWDVPYSITTRELLPQIRANPNFLAARHLEIVRGASDAASPLPATSENLAALASGKLRLRQLPGADNALGLVKFMLPNRYNVYLHSTPTPDLFKEARRAFSHGCIRVSDPVALAQFVLRDTPGNWTPDRIAALMQGPATRRVSLSESIPVMILYATAAADEGGQAYFFEDLYGHDAHLEALLHLAPSAPPLP